MRQEGIYIVAVAACLAVLGCTPKEAAPAEPAEEAAKAAPTPDPAAAEPVAAKDPSTEAQEIFQTRCVTCHGANGTGDGPGSAALNPKPRNYTSAEWQASVTDDDLEKIIIGGGAAVGLSPLMPPNPDLVTKPAVVDALVAIIRGFGAKK